MQKFSTELILILKLTQSLTIVEIPQIKLNTEQWHVSIITVDQSLAPKYVGPPKWKSLKSEQSNIFAIMLCKSPLTF